MFRCALKVMVLWGLFTAGFLSGCAYSIGSGDRKLPQGYTLIGVPVFKNLTHEAGAEVVFTNAMIREIGRNQIGRVVPKAEAQVLLEGIVESIRFPPSVQIKDDSAPIPKSTILNTEYRILVAVALVLKRASDGSTVWSERFTKEASYLAPKIGAEGLNSVNALYNDSARYDNLASMATDLMAEAHTRLTENF